MCFINQERELNGEKDGCHQTSKAGKTKKMKAVGGMKACAGSGQLVAVKFGLWIFQFLPFVCTTV